MGSHIYLENSRTRTRRRSKFTEAQKPPTIIWGANLEMLSWVATNDAKNCMTKSGMAGRGFSPALVVLVVSVLVQILGPVQAVSPPGKRITSNLVAELGKRPRELFSFGIGKRSISAKEMAEYLAEQEAEGGHQDNTAEAVMSPSSGRAGDEGEESSGDSLNEPIHLGPSAMAKRDPYSFGLGKRSPYSFGLGKRDPYAFGLGKRDPYSFGLGKRSEGDHLSSFDGEDPYAFGFGKRDPYSFGLGKRDPYSFGLGK